LEKKYPNKEILVVYGGIDALEREKIRKKMESKTGLILIATYQTLSTGWNVKNLHQIVFFASYKAKITVLQSIGRGLRTHESKDMLMMFDCVDDLRVPKKTQGNFYENHTYIHWKERMTYYTEQKFETVNKEIRI
jgi:superfamily II DNA or RNA helicase